MNLRQRYVVEAERFKKETDSKDSWSRLRVNVFEKRGKKKHFLVHMREIIVRCITRLSRLSKTANIMP